MLYQFHELNRTLLAPAMYLAQAGARMLTAPDSWLAQMPGAAGAAAGYELFFRLGKSYEKPSFGIEEVEAHGAKVAIVERTVLERPFCRLRRFKRYGDQADVVAACKHDPVVLLVAPLSGHHATLLRDTVRTLLSTHKVYVTDWLDARTVPTDQGSFSLADYVGYMRDFIRHIGTERLSVISVCQATVPVLAAVSLMAAAGEPVPRSLVMMGGPIDPRRSPTSVNQLANSKPLSWFETHAIHEVPSNHPGRGRRVYPGFLQHASFIAMNPWRHMSSHWEFYQQVARGELDDADDHRRFYDEYNAVLDMPAEYYLDCIRVVFQEYLLPRGAWSVGGQRVAPEALTATAVMTIEGDNDDISGLGQTEAALDLCSGIPPDRKRHLTVEGAGHYGIFSGRRWREIVYPQVRDFIASSS